MEDDLIELYDLVISEVKLKRDMSELRNELKEIKETMDEIKKNIVKGMKKSNHKYAQFKNMNVSLIQKPERIKPDSTSIVQIIDKIIDMDINTQDKRSQILTILKPRNTGNVVDKLNIKLLKK